MTSFKSEWKMRRKEMIKKEIIIKGEENIIKEICKMEDDFLNRPNRNLASDLICKWGELNYFRYYHRLPRGMNRIDPLYNFLNADEYFFKFRRERKKREALNLLERLRHDD